LHAEFGEHHYGRIDLEVKPAQKQKAIHHFSDDSLKKIDKFPVVRRENMDGIKVYLGEIGWVMVRASGTENLLRIYSETNSPASTKQVLQAIVSTIQQL